ncbi:hypothetical protein F5Y16DRAFT_404194 [Xylariaceae sp. FL0255]|nr:hypothetical protein F5Y16DRAFT_404194 [Xylariaceae sp. FL0255]
MPQASFAQFAWLPLPKITTCVVYHELQCLLMLANADQGGTESSTGPLSRAPQLRGIIRSSDHSGVIAFVESFIPYHRTLYYIDLTKVDISRRERWIREIEETIFALHRAGITWSDVKADNVLINSSTDEAWLIDFGGGRIDGWAFSETAGTIDEDLACHKHTLSAQPSDIVSAQPPRKYTRTLDIVLISSRNSLSFGTI